MVKIPAFPKSWRQDTKPHKFCPGCGEAELLKMLGFVIDDLGIAPRTVYGCDIGCMLLSWDFFNINTIQTHHGRTVPVMTGVKMASPKTVAIAFAGDGGAYAIGSQHLVNAAVRNDNITVIVANNANYAMTGGQEAPTTIPTQITDTTPLGADKHYLLGPEMVAQIAPPEVYIARGSIARPLEVRKILKRALEHQISCRGFSFVEVLTSCPTNWKTDAQGSLDFLEDLEKYFPTGEISAHGHRD